MLSTLSGCGIFSTTKMIDNYCALYEPVRNYLESEEAVVDQIDLNNGIYLERCYD